VAAGVKAINAGIEPRIYGGPVRRGAKWEKFLAENVRRSEHPKRFKRVCKHGHDLVPGNLYFWKRRDGWVRACRACGLDRSLAQKAKRRAA
jgi:hypothetical protein